MRTIIIVSAVLLSGCSEAPAVTYEDISKRDMLLAKEMDKVAKLEERVGKLEDKEKLMLGWIQSNRKQASSAFNDQAKQDAFDQMETDRRLSDLER